ncbi:hypothetical protein [Jiangella mangrovi]|uniref:VWA domain-containing protein n=1 Tax=Jiangella mangrovi TaxID=1524084 RepID=A0A7W9LNY7_9ACTN|nr:hypothetical protein [Jiangella mangrovi]MBB5790828.1 hypothetical protein [Jiangella mangrovi]
MAACGDPADARQATDQLRVNQRLAETCPDGQELAAFVGTDLSGTGRDPSIATRRATVIEDIVRRVAVCSGRLRVVAFSASSAASLPVFDGELRPPGATQIARLRKVPDLVESTVPTIVAALEAAAEALPADGSDITAQFGAAAEFIGQLDSAGAGAHRLDVTLLTDGVQTSGVTLNTAELTVAVAQELASRLPAPTLPAGSAVTIAGIGRVAGPPPPTTYVDALKAFYDAYCRRTAAACTVVTDHVTGS